MQLLVYEASFLVAGGAVAGVAFHPQAVGLRSASGGLFISLYQTPKTSRASLARSTWATNNT